eukprot:TRINITY_DN6497_c0_g3_i1.p1 TRINITY_DN6497_c0_g3~~TRINITY_DN6497_c0_g3_i1.p1  ORF type:complete len:260 (+),score=75.40 TRINITY_DN6497_c0_g3_i1:23-781(+)
MSWLIAVTGANRGFGRAVAVELARNKPDSEMVLTCRKGCEGIEDTLQEVRKLCKGNVKVWEVDMAEDDLSEKTKTVFKEFQEKDFERVVFVHNAASLGELVAAADHTEQSVKDSVQANITAPIAISCSFMKSFPKLSEKLTFVNVSSLFAVQPFKGFSLYCAGKAARDLFFSSLTLDHPAVRTLNYAPGPMETAMAQHIRDTHHAQDVKDTFAKLDMVDPADSAAILTKQVLADTFTTGAHIDYFDLLPKKE